MDSLQIKNIYWQKQWKIPGTSWQICGFSRSAYRTGFYITELDLMLDAGPQNFSKPKTILITHSHIDHLACLPLTMLGDVHSGHIFEIYGPKVAKDYIENYIKSMFEVNALANMRNTNFYKYNGLEMRAQDPFKLPMNKNNMEIAVFECDHGIPTVSYGLSEIKTKLKEEFIGLSGKEIGKLRADGVNISKEVIYKRLAYICDTSISVFDLNPDILNYSVIFIECTFFMDDELDNAISTKHIHWQTLKPYVLNNPQITFMLFHFSQRYPDKIIGNFFQKEVDAGIRNLNWW